jgi:hypothetical protein
MSCFRFQLAAFTCDENFSGQRVEKAHRTSLGEHLIKYFELIEYLIQLTW